jgi:hypothetical protein
MHYGEQRTPTTFAFPPADDSPNTPATPPVASPELLSQASLPPPADQLGSRSGRIVYVEPEVQTPEPEGGGEMQMVVDEKGEKEELIEENEVVVEDSQPAGPLVKRLGFERGSEASIEPIITDSDDGQAWEGILRASSDPQSRPIASVASPSLPAAADRSESSSSPPPQSTQNSDDGSPHSISDRRTPSPGLESYASPARRHHHLPHHRSLQQPPDPDVPPLEVYHLPPSTPPSKLRAPASTNLSSPKTTFLWNHWRS